jgi:hypothetical protein
MDGMWKQWKHKVSKFKKCVHMFVNAKMIPVETTPGIGGKGDKGER